MSTVTLKKLERDLATTRLDLNSLQGATSGIGLIDPVDLGTIRDDEAFFTQAPYPEIYQQAPARHQVPVTFKLRVKAASRSARLTLLRTLMGELNTPGTYVWKPDSSEDPVYFDAYGAEFPSEFHGQDYSQTMAVTKADDIIQVVLWRQPYLYGPRLDSTVNRLLNAMMWIDTDGDGTPNNWTNSAGTLTIDEDNHALQISANATSVKVYQDVTLSAGQLTTGSIEGYVVSGDRTVRLELVSRPSGTTLDTADLPTSGWGQRVEVSGNVSGGDTAARLQIAYTGGSTTTVAKVRNAQLETGSSVSSDFRCGSETVGTDPATGGRIMGFYAQGNAPTRSRFVMRPNTGATVVEVGLAKRVVGNLAEFAANHFVQSSSFSNGTNTSTVGSDSSASGSSKSRCTFGTEDMLRRVYGNFNVVDPETLMGTFKFMARIKIDAATNFQLRLHWSPGLTITPAFVADKVKLEPDSSTNWLWVELGTITVDRRSTDLSWEIWASRNSTGTGSSANMEFDYVALVPIGPVGLPTADEFVSLNARGWKDTTGSNRRRWRGDELKVPSWAVGGGGVDGDFSFIQNTNHIRVTPPLSGLVLDNGRYVVTALLTITHTAGDNGGRGTRRKVGELQLLTTTGTVVDRKDITIMDSVSRSRHKTKLHFDITSSSARMYGVKQTAGSDVDIKIHHITERFQRSFGNSDYLVYSGEYGHVEGPPSSYIAAGSSYAEPMYQEGPFFEHPPGPQLIIIDPLDVINAKNEDLDRRYPSGILVITRTLVVDSYHYPRWFA